MLRLGDRGADLLRLRRRCPDRRADIHRGEFAVRALFGPGHAGLLVFLGEPRIEHAAELHVAGVAAGRDHDALFGLDRDVLAVRLRDDAAHAALVVVVANDARHLVAAENLRALLARALGEPPHKSRAVAVSSRRDDLFLDVPLVGDEGARHARSVRRRHRLVDEGDAVVEQELERRDALVGVLPHEIAVVVAGVATLVIGPVGEQLVGRILDAVLLLERVAAAEMHAPAAQHGVAADIVIFLDEDHGGAVVARRDSRRQARGAGADDHHVSRKIPFHSGICLGAKSWAGIAVRAAFWRRRARGQGGRARGSMRETRASPALLSLPL